MTNEFNANSTTDFVNNSGQGSNTPIVSLVTDKFNWGAFGLSWFWGLFNKSFITLISIPIFFIPFLGGLINFGLSIWYGIQGNKWAWQNKKWKSIEQFHNHQKKWAIGFVIYVILVALLILVMTLPAVMYKTSAVEDKLAIRKALAITNSATLIMEAMGEQCELSSNGLANCFAKRLDERIEKSSKNVLELKDGSVWTFKGNGSCISKGDCSISVSGEDFKETLTIPLYVKEGNFIETREENNQKYSN